MKPTSLIALLALLILAAILAACAKDSERAPTSNTILSITPSASVTPALPSESTTASIPSTDVNPPDTTTNAPSTSTTAPSSTTPLLSTPAVSDPSMTDTPITTTTPVTTPPETTPPATTPPATTAPPVTTPPVTTPPLPPEIPNNPWVVTCEEYITLRREPSTVGTKITTIPDGETVDLLEFTGLFAKVRWQRQTGYVMAVYLTRSQEIGSALDLSVVKPVENYSYEQMQIDLATLAELYPDLLTLSSIGKSEEGRDLTLCILGNPQAERRVFLQASIHGREHVVTLLTMCEIDYLLSHPDMVTDGGMTVKELLSNVAIHIVPMSNPDGVTICQTGILPEAFAELYKDQPWVTTYWKANAKGIDLNANFDADWALYESIYESSEPSYAGYKGTAPECAAESIALAEYIRQEKFDLILSYHTSGSLIYWSYDYENRLEVNEKCFEIASLLSEKSGFILGEQVTSSTAGLKDYSIQTLFTPSLTVEFAISVAPSPFQEFEQIWARGKNTMLTSAIWVLDQNTDESDS